MCNLPKAIYKKKITEHRAPGGHRAEGENQRNQLSFHEVAGSMAQTCTRQTLVRQSKLLGNGSTQKSPGMAEMKTAGKDVTSVPKEG